MSTPSTATGTRLPNRKILHKHSDTGMWVRHPAKSFYYGACPKRFPFHNTPFGRLPPEIRQRVFELVLVYPEESLKDGLSLALRKEPIPLCDGSDGRKQPVDGPKQHSFSRLSLLATCRQIYIESYGIFYANHTIYLANAQDIYGFLKTLGPSRRQHISKLHLAALTMKVERYTKAEVNHLMTSPILTDVSRQYLEDSLETILDPDAMHARQLLRQCPKLRSITLDVQVGEVSEYIKWLVTESLKEQNLISFETESHWKVTVGTRQWGKRPWGDKTYLGFLERQCKEETRMDFNGALLGDGSTHRFQVELSSPPDILFDEGLWRSHPLVVLLLISCRSAYEKTWRGTLGGRPLV